MKDVGYKWHDIGENNSVEQSKPDEPYYPSIRVPIEVFSDMKLKPGDDFYLDIVGHIESLDKKSVSLKITKVKYEEDSMDEKDLEKMSPEDGDKAVEKEFDKNKSQLEEYDGEEAGE